MLPVAVVTAPVLPAVAIVTRHDDGTLTVRPAEFTPAEECDRAWREAQAVMVLEAYRAHRARRQEGAGDGKQ